MLTQFVVTQNIKHGLILYKLLRQCTPSEEFVQFNFQENMNQRLQHHNFIKIQNYYVGKNIFLFRLCTLNNMISTTMTVDSFI